jgi:dUTPase
MPPKADELAKRQGYVLSCEDLGHEISIRELLFRKDKNNVKQKLTLEEIRKGVQGDCYDFRVGCLVSKRLGRSKGTIAVTLEPGEIVRLLSKEWVSLPDNIQAFVIPRNTPAQRGLLVLNAGHIAPGYVGQIEAQVVNLSARELSIKLEDFAEGVFSAVFSYLHTPIPSTKREVITWESEEERLARIEANIGEQAGTLVLAESEMRKRFVSQDRFTRLLVTNIVGFTAGLGVLVGILTGTGIINFKNFPIEGWTKPLWLTVVVVIGSLSITYAFLSPLISYALKKCWPWWQKKINP